MIRSSLYSSAALALAAGLALAGCSDSSDPSKITGQEVLVAVNSTEASLSVVPVDSLAKGFKIALGGSNPTPVGVSVRGATVLVPLGDDNAVAVVDLRTRSVVRTIALAANSGATGSAIVDDSIAYVANPNLNTVTRVNYVTGDTASLPAGQYPQGVLVAKGRVYVLAGNLVEFAPVGPSALIVIDPKTNTRVAGADSIPLTGPGNAGFADADADGLLYVMNTGPYTGTGRLSIVDPSARAEVATADGFGAAPGPIAFDRTSRRLFVSSYAEGLMVYDTKSRTMVRGAGNGLAVPSNAGVTVDGEGRIYALETGACAGGEPGTAHVFNTDLTAIGTVKLGECPVGAAVTKIPD